MIPAGRLFCSAAEDAPSRPAEFDNDNINDNNNDSNDSHNHIIVITVVTIIIIIIVIIIMFAAAEPRLLYLGGIAYLANATCLIRSHLCYAVFMVSRIIMICYFLRHLFEEDLSQTSSARQVVPPDIIVYAQFPY